jgi:hypothetical protein
LLIGKARAYRGFARMSADQERISDIVPSSELRCLLKWMRRNSSSSIKENTLCDHQGS